ncbi:MAG TPA: hypothetical protein VN280_22405 [Variovorax sp.]|nr:hypothetical protein [Variovorax sp.]
MEAVVERADAATRVGKVVPEKRLATEKRCAMSAVATKPLVDARQKAQESQFPQRIENIFEGLQRGQERLQLAHASVEMTDTGAAADVLLRAVVKDMLPAAIAPMWREPLAQTDVDAAYDNMFVSLAAIEGAIALMTGHVLADTLREAHGLLDAAHSAMNFVDLGDVLHQRDDSTAEVIQPSAHGDEPHDAYAVILNALTCADIAANHGDTDVFWALRSLVEKVSEKVEKANSARQGGDYSEALHEDASNEMAGLLALVRVLDDDTEPLLSAIETLIIVAKAQIDREIGQAQE